MILQHWLNILASFITVLYEIEKDNGSVVKFEKS